MSAICPASLTPCAFRTDSVICCRSSSSCRNPQPAILPPDCFALPQAPDIAALALLSASVSSTSASSASASSSQTSGPSPTSSSTSSTISTSSPTLKTPSTFSTLVPTTTTSLGATTFHTTTTLTSTTTTAFVTTASPPLPTLGSLTSTLPDVTGTVHPRTVLSASLGTGLGVLFAVVIGVFFVLYRKDKKRKLRGLEKGEGGARMSGAGRRRSVMSWPPQLPGFGFTGSGGLGVEGVGRDSPASLEGVLAGGMAEEGGASNVEDLGTEKEAGVVEEVRRVGDERVKSADIGLAV